MKNYWLLLVSLLLLLPSCKPVIRSEALYGKLKYIKVENPNAHPPDSVRKADLEEQVPYIVFNTDHTLKIVWAGKQLSHGKFTISGSSILYQEDLGNGKTRKFPFFVSKIDAKNLIFETLGEDGSKVTAVKW